jgi:Cu(I)/Ag(I) efflux system membrane fusion protein
MLIVGLGVAQRFGLISAGGGSERHANNGNSSSRYICPMMCTPPQSEPGRCPVCAMELVPATTGGGGGELSIEIDPAARRVANIETVPVRAAPMSRTIRAIGELTYDEGTLKTISAYVDGRLDRLYADYTGVVVNKGDHLALVYSPRLYSSQVEYLLAKKSRDNGRNSTLARVVESNEELLKNARQRLIELGMTETQIDQLESDGEANSRLHLCAPISGTVIKKLAVEGQYVKEGQAIYQLADLSTVWLMLRLFPEDAAAMRYGQKVEAEVQSLAGRKFTGRVAFIDPSVDPKTRTVGVRVVIPNL